MEIKLLLYRPTFSFPSQKYLSIFLFFRSTVLETIETDYLVRSFLLDWDAAKTPTEESFCTLQSRLGCSLLVPKQE